ncbi:FAD-binding oxidoreductase [Gemmatimonas sp.]|uniref:FAD-binding oxidoreductase n=1 Tax=Gemmatimonas sp. TaxID=1962908 RepID=UPI0039831817
MTTLTAAPPASSVAAAIAAAIVSQTAARAVGSGTWLHGGPVDNDAGATVVRVRGGVIEYTPGDLVITVHAGTTLEELSAVCAASGQMLAIAPYGSPRSTIGAVVATASAAPLAYEDLTVRDLVLGLTAVTGTGDVVRVGGKVVKNVAGFDLVRLNTGAFGTLGIITEVSIRLHAKPIMDHVITGTLIDAPTAWVPRLIANRAPLPMLVRLAPDESAQLFARCTGNEARASALRGIVQSYGARNAFTLGPSDTSNASDSALSESASPVSLLRHVPQQALVLRARTKPAHGAILIEAARVAFPEATLLYHPARGSVRITTLATDNADARVAAFVASAAPSTLFSVVVEQGAVPLPSAADLDLLVKRAFDPHGILNRRRPGSI